MDSIFLNGKWVSKKGAVVSVFDRGFMFGDSVYEVYRFQRKDLCPESPFVAPEKS